MSEKKSYRYLMDKKPLIDLLPTVVPLSVLIEPTNRCNYACKFCPTGDKKAILDSGRDVGMMGFSLFMSIISGMKMFDERINVLHLFKDGEPLLHPDIIEMVKCAKRKDVAGVVELTTNGFLLSEGMGKGLVDAGLDVLRVSIAHVDGEKYNILTGVDGLDRVRKNIEWIYNFKKGVGSDLKVFVKTIDTGFSDKERDEFEMMFSDISDYYNIDELVGWGGGDKKDTMMGRTVKKGIDGLFGLKDIDVCPDIFKGVAINHNGLVSACCVDWCHELIVGDLRKESFYEIWNGSNLNELRVKHIRGERRNMPMCASCQYVQGMDPISYLDEHKEKLKTIYGG